MLSMCGCRTSARCVVFFYLTCCTLGVTATDCAVRQPACDNRAAARLDIPSVHNQDAPSECVSFFQRSMTLLSPRASSKSLEVVEPAGLISKELVLQTVGVNVNATVDIDTKRKKRSRKEEQTQIKEKTEKETTEKGILLVGNISKGTTVERLDKLFSPYGGLISCHLTTKLNTTNAYVKLSNAAATERAIKGLNGKSGMIVSVAHLDSAATKQLKSYKLNKKTGKHLDMVAPKHLRKENVWKYDLPAPPPGLRSWPRVVMKRGRHATPDLLKHQDLDGVINFFGSVVCSEWFIFSGFVTFFFILYYFMIEWPSTKRFHAVALLIWVLLGMIYNSVIYLRLGEVAARAWFTGYILELIFSIENVFVFHIVIRAFRTPRRHAQKAIFVVIMFQILFEMVFYMGLATWIRQSTVLPYVLGLWLMYVGVQAVHEDHSNDEFNLKDSWVFCFSKKVFGDRLRVAYESTASFVVHRKDLHHVTLLVPLTFCLLAVDFLLEVDVTLTKIEELQNHYIAFSSSVAAAFAVPELFFVCRDLFARFKLLKYGVCFVLVFFGGQMMIHTLVEIEPLTGCAITIGVMMTFMFVSQISEDPSQNADNEEGSTVGEDDGFAPEPPTTPGRAWKERPHPWQWQSPQQNHIKKKRQPPVPPKLGTEEQLVAGISVANPGSLPRVQSHVQLNPSKSNPV